jgi:glycosyltransferase involved in cell wall biosynthesis
MTDTANFKPCFVIPVYDHEHAIGPTLVRLREFNLPCLLVDDGSSAACAHVLDELARTQADWLTLVRRERNGGKGAAVKTGLTQAAALGFTHALQIDADGQHDTNAIAPMLRAAASEPDAVIAAVPIFDESISALRLYGRYLTHVWVWINTLSLHIRDSMCGFRVYPLTTTLAEIRRARALGDRMDFDPEILVRLYWAGVTIRQIPSAVHYPLDGVSHFRGGLDNWLISRMHTRLFFGMLWRLPALLKRKWLQRKSPHGKSPQHNLSSRGRP